MIFTKEKYLFLGNEWFVGSSINHHFWIPFQKMSDDDEPSPKRAKFSFHSTPKGKQINVQRRKGSIMRAVSHPSGHKHYVHVDQLAYLLRHKVDDPYQKGSRLALSRVE